MKTLTVRLKEAENRAEQAEKSVKRLQKEVDRLEGALSHPLIHSTLTFCLSLRHCNYISWITFLIIYIQSLFTLTRTIFVQHFFCLSYCGHVTQQQLNSLINLIFLLELLFIGQQPPPTYRTHQYICICTYVDGKFLFPIVVVVVFVFVGRWVTSGAFY